MMGFIHTGSGFKGTIDYILDTGHLNGKDVEVLSAAGVNIPLSHRFRHVFDPSRIAESFRAQSQLNPKISKPVRHLILSWPDNDTAKLTSEEMTDVALDYMKRMEIVNTQFIIVRHREKNNPHVHLIYNVVDNDGCHLNESNFLRRNIRVCREITLERGYTWGKEKAISQADINTPKARVQYALARTVTEQVYYSTGMEDLFSRLEALSISMRIRHYDANGKDGVVFIAKGEKGDSLCFSGRSLGRHLSYGSIQRIFRNKDVYDESFERALSLIETAGGLPGSSLTETSRMLVTELQNTYYSALATRRYCNQTFPKAQAQALSAAINLGGRVNKMLRLANLLTPPMARATGSSPQPSPSEQEKRDKRREKYFEEAAGGINVSFKEHIDQPLAP